jgi:hypothetical protein
MLRGLIFLTLGQLATGILIFISFVPLSKIGSGFGRFHAGLAAGLWLLAAWGQFNPLHLVLLGILVIIAAFVRSDIVYYPLLITSIGISFYVLMKNTLGPNNLLGALEFHLPAVLVLGASSIAMLLGHWYLVAPKLSISYLQRITIFLIGAIVLRCLLIAIAYFSHQEFLSENYFFERYGIFFIQRVALGLFLTLVLSIMTYFCVRIRSTQSATGILYVVVVFCLIGEIIGSYLFAKTGMFF